MFDAALEREILGPNINPQTPQAVAFYALSGMGGWQCQQLIQDLQVNADPETLAKRMKGKGGSKAKDLRVVRYEGEVFQSDKWQEPEPVPQDPRKGDNKKLPTVRPVRKEFAELKWEVRRFLYLNLTIHPPHLLVR
jgi:hypothetical protein